MSNAVTIQVTLWWKCENETYGTRVVVSGIWKSAKIGRYVCKTWASSSMVTNTTTRSKFVKWGLFWAPGNVCFSFLFFLVFFLIYKWFFTFRFLDYMYRDYDNDEQPPHHTHTTTPSRTATTSHHGHHHCQCVHPHNNWVKWGSFWAPGNVLFFSFSFFSFTNDFLHLELVWWLLRISTSTLDYIYFRLELFLVMTRFKGD